MSSQKVENWKHKKYVRVNKGRRNEVIAEHKTWGKCFVEHWLKERKVSGGNLKTYACVLNEKGYIGL